MSHILVFDTVYALLQWILPHQRLAVSKGLYSLARRWKEKGHSWRLPTNPSAITYSIWERLLQHFSRLALAFYFTLLQLFLTSTFLNWPWWVRTVY